MIPAWEQKLTNKIRAHGKRHYDVWYGFAVHLISVYAIIWLVFFVKGWVKWWEPIVIPFAAWILTLISQQLVGRERPQFEQTTGYKMWWRTYSFPSGHALISAAMATVLLFSAHFTSPLPVVLLACAFLIIEMLISLGRVVVGVHYLGDVITGFVMGIGFGVVWSVL